MKTSVKAISDVVGKTVEGAAWDWEYFVISFTDGTFLALAAEYGHEGNTTIAFHGNQMTSRQYLIEYPDDILIEGRVVSDSDEYQDLMQKIEAQRQADTLRDERRMYEKLKAKFEPKTTKGV